MSDATQDDEPAQIEELAIDEVRELLAAEGAQVTDEQAEQLAKFVSAAGGVDNALEALLQLVGQVRAA